jgi:signal transduction histidine kinase
MIVCMEATAVVPDPTLRAEPAIPETRSGKFTVIRSEAPALAPLCGAAKRRPCLHDLLENEARRMAQSLHDEAGQLLALVYLKLDELTGRVPEAQLGSVGTLRASLGELESELRRLSHELRPMILDDFGLLPAVEFLKQGVTARTGISVKVDGTVRGRLTATIETALYRVIYEALRMASQGHARRVHITLLRQGSRVECSIRQEGGDSNGRDAALTAIRQRVDDLSGRLLSCTSPNGNLVVVIGIPVE